MRPVIYPNEKCPDYEDLFLEIFSTKIAEMQSDWDDIQRNFPSLQQFPNQIRSILTAKFDDLVKYYNTYQEIPSITNQDLVSSLEYLFDYEKWSSGIAEYFMNPLHSFNFSTCHYCDMSYVNAYEINTEDSAIFFLNVASDKELMNKLKTKSERSVNEYKKARPYKSKNDFDIVAHSCGCASDKFKKAFNIHNKYRRHFDIEHVLPKSMCPLVALSLYNYVPSCQICNSKLKKTTVLGLFGTPNEKLSPTSNNFKFEDIAKFLIIPKYGGILKSHPTDNPEDYKLVIDTTKDPDYNFFVKLFKLEERYDYHKILALYWKGMKLRYSDAHIQMMANALKSPDFSFTRIEDDIFQKNIDAQQHRTFSKLKEDMIK